MEVSGQLHAPAEVGFVNVLHSEVKHFKILCTRSWSAVLLLCVVPLVSQPGSIHTYLAWNLGLLSPFLKWVKTTLGELSDHLCFDVYMYHTSNSKQLKIRPFDFFVSTCLWLVADKGETRGFGGRVQPAATLTLHTHRDFCLNTFQITVRWCSNFIRISQGVFYFALHSS
jgi:hypothetical protein